MLINRQDICVMYEIVLFVERTATNCLVDIKITGYSLDTSVTVTTTYKRMISFVVSRLNICPLFLKHTGLWLRRGTIYGDTACILGVAHHLLAGMCMARELCVIGSCLSVAALPSWALSTWLRHEWSTSGLSNNSLKSTIPHSEKSRDLDNEKLCWWKISRWKITKSIASSQSKNVNKNLLLQLYMKMRRISSLSLSYKCHKDFPTCWIQYSDYTNIPNLLNFFTFSSCVPACICM
jgi:hypothetical protein